MPFPLAANTVDAAALADELARFRVVDQAQLVKLLAEFTGSGPAALAEFLVRRDVLTPFQAERALAGESRMLALGPYRLTGRAGPGTFGPLFTATHTSKPGQFSVRVLPLRSLWKARQAKQLARTLSAAVTHPAVAPLLEVDSANGFHYLVWRAVEGERLADRVGASGPLHAGDAAAMFGHLASALAACHACSAVHGAITPHSVAIGASGLPQLLELGAGAILAQSVADDESLFDSMSAAFGSAAVLTFAAPELAAEPHMPAVAADQYALGAIGYFAVTGLPPFPHPTLAEQLRAKRAGPPPSAAVVNPEIPAELAAVFERMMAPDPADRFATLEEVEDRLAELATSDPSPLAESPVIESLMLSKLHPRDSSGAISWSATGSGVVRLPARDDSDASVTFELPDPPETLPNALPEELPEALEDDPPPARATVETPPSVQTARRPELAERPRLRDSGADRPSDPRLTAPTPVQWHTANTNSAPDADEAETGPPARSVVWKTVKRKLLFWQAATDAVQVSVFGPSAVTPGQAVRLTIFLHPPAATDNVRTLSRAFQHDAELIGTGYLTREVARAAELAVHLSVANAGVARTLLKCQWRGQPHRLGFELHVPWESPEGTSPGLVSVGLNDVRVGRIEFRLNVLPRKA